MYFMPSSDGSELKLLDGDGYPGRCDLPRLLEHGDVHGFVFHVFDYYLQLLSRKSSQVLRDGREARRVFVLSHQTVGHESARNAPSIEPGSPLPHVPPSGQVVGGC